MDSPLVALSRVIAVENAGMGVELGGGILQARRSGEAT